MIKIDYFPVINLKLLQSCQDAVSKEKESEPLCHFSLLPNEVTLMILGFLARKDFANASSLCKKMYLASKTPVLWKQLFTRHFPQLQPLEPAEISFSVEQQFKILNYHVSISNGHKESLLRKKVDLLRGPSGFNGQIDAAWKKYDELQRHYDEMSPVLQTILARKLNNMRSEYISLDNLLKRIVGREFDGTEESIDFRSKLGNEIWIKSLRQNINQEKFGQMLQYLKNAVEQNANTRSPKSPKTYAMHRSPRTPRSPISSRSPIILRSPRSLRSRHPRVFLFHKVSEKFKNVFHKKLDGNKTPPKGGD